MRWIPLPKCTKLAIVPESPARSVAAAEKRGLSRRQALQKMLAGIGVAMAAPVVAAHPIHRHLANLATMAQADAKAALAKWSPVFLDAAQNQTLVAIAERIVPGSTQAQVNRVIDLLLTVDTVSNRENFVSSLSALDREAQQKYGKQFSVLAPNQQDEVLAACASGQESHAASVSDDPDELGPEKVPLTTRDHFENLKGWIAGTYYATEVGMRELGWTEDFYFDELPACQHEGEHASAEHGAGEAVAGQAQGFSQDKS
jgi:hypothetical protein